MLGWLGVALTGSDTSSNVLFGSLQRITAEQLGLSPTLMAAANSSGGVMGKMIDAQSIVVASTATRWYGHEGEILRYVFFHSIVLALLVGIARVPAGLRVRRSRRWWCDERCAGREPAFVDELERMCGSGGVFHEPVDVLAYECDGLPHLRATPAAVVLPSSAAQVQAVVRLCHREGVPFVARGHGTGLSGGALPVAGGIVIGLGRLNRVLEIDIPNRRVTVEPGVTNLEITRRVAPHGYYYAPDPSSQQVCSIGGNIAENSGGAHCLKYGFTVHHVLALDFVLPDGELVHVGSGSADAPGPDLLGLIIGSEGTLGIVTRAVVRILRRPESVQTLLAAFDGIDEAGEAVSDIIAAGIVPAAVEIMDALTIRAVEAAVHPGFPPADAVLIVELDGPAAEVQALFETVEQICRRTGRQQPSRSRATRRSAPVSGRAGRRRLPRWAASRRTTTCRTASCRARACPKCCAASASSRLVRVCRIGNVFHAGDGNLHPLICYDERVPGEADRAAAAAGEILSFCVEAGGSITGEHGVGADKRDYMPVMFSDADLEMMRRVRRAFDPRGLCNPGKVLPTPRLCGEKAGPYRPHPAEQAGLADRSRRCSAQRGSGSDLGSSMRRHP